MNLPIISIITVSYNAVSTIENTILSVINQTYPHIEYIIIDGGSSDGTVDIIKKYSDKISYWVSEPDNGIYNAMNKGIHKSSGKWINFMNAGDTFYNNNTLKDIHFEDIDNSTINIIYGDTIKKIKGKSTYIKAKDIDQLNRTIICCHQSVFISSNNKSKTIFDEKYKISSDYKILYDIYQQQGKSAFYHVSFPISIYDGEYGISSINRILLFKEQLEIRASHKGLIWYIDYIRYKIKSVLSKLH